MWGARCREHMGLWNVWAVRCGVTLVVWGCG